MALEWLKQELRALLPPGQRWLYAMRHELVRVQTLQRRERARERVLQAELDAARADLASWQVRRDVASGLGQTHCSQTDCNQTDCNQTDFNPTNGNPPQSNPAKSNQAELTAAAQREVERAAAQVEALQHVLAKQQTLTQTLGERLTAMEARFLTASEQDSDCRRPALLIASTLAELRQREQRFAACEQRLQKQWQQRQANTPPAPADAPARASDGAASNTVTGAPANVSAAASIDAPADAVAGVPADTQLPVPASGVDADFVTSGSSPDKPERAP